MFNLGWGNSVCVREAFLSTCNVFDYNTTDLFKNNYTEHTGDLDVVAITRDVIKRQTDLTFKHVILTTGATGAITVALRAYNQLYGGIDTVYTRKPPFFPLYPLMAAAAGLKLSYDNPINKKGVGLIDLPSNPHGSFYTATAAVMSVIMPLIIDAVYFNNIYCTEKVKMPYSDVLAGSFSKLLGINGVRIGWLATNNDKIADIANRLVTAEYAGLSGADYTIIKKVSKDLDWQLFEKRAKDALDLNRSEWSKLERFFNNEPVPVNGMFYYAEIDKSCAKLLKKAEVNYVKGSACGTDDSYGRFNLGQNCSYISAAVKTIIKVDKRTKK